MEKQALYSIGDVSAICHIPIKTLRYYDEIGLVKPSAKNPDTGYRYYEKEQILQIQLVKRLKELRFSLAQIQDMISTQDTAYLQTCIQTKLDDLNRDIASLRSIHLSGQFFLERMKKGNSILEQLAGDMPQDAFSAASMELEEIPEQDVLFLRRTLQNYRNEEAHVDCWGELIEQARREHAVVMGPLYALYHQHPLEQFYTNTCDYELCLPVMSMHPSDSSHYRHNRSFQAVTTYHVGDYAGLLHPYMMAMQWIRESGYEIDGPMSDEFLVSPIETPNSAKHITKIIIPVRKAA